jgi:hypothetical protein
MNGDSRDSESTDEARPAWWRANDRLREEYGLPEYEPPTFEDGSYVHEVVAELEAEYECTIRLVNEDPTETDSWTVLVGGERVESAGQHRDASVNSVFELTAPTFRRVVESAVESGEAE